MIIGIDASNVGGGGGITHLKEILSEYQSSIFQERVTKIIVFSSRKVLDELPNSDIIEKITFSAFNEGIMKRLIFQIFRYDKEIKSKCDILLSITGDYIGRFSPMVGMSRNMLLYERNIWKEIKELKEVLRFWLNFIKQKICFQNANGIIFISNYAREYITKELDLSSKSTCIIHHGISPRFSGKVREQFDISEYSVEKPFRFLYVSTIHVYKHQWNVVEAIGKLREKGYNVQLDLVGEVIFKPAGKKLFNSIAIVDPDNTFIKYHSHVPYKTIDEFYKQADGIIYASTCENMPNILIEAMASGVPIIASEKQPMPEFLTDNGFYFNAYDVDSIIFALEMFLKDPISRFQKANDGLQEVSRYSWTDTSTKTFEYLIQIKNNI